MFRTTMMGLALVLGMGAVGCSAQQQSFHVDAPTDSTTIIRESPEDASKPMSAAALRIELAAHRQEQIARLQAYSDAGVFPKNVNAPVLVNVMRDGDGHLCAVANLIHRDGRDDIVDAAVKENNFMLIAQQKTGAIHQWVLESGLTAEEISMIQAPYMPARPDLESQNLERTRLQAHFKSVLKLLADSTDASLAVAVARMTGQKDSKVVATSQFATPPGV